METIQYQTNRHTTVTRKVVPESSPAPKPRKQVLAPAVLKQNSLTILPNFAEPAPTDVVLIEGLMTRKAAETLQQVLRHLRD